MAFAGKEPAPIVPGKIITRLPGGSWSEKGFFHPSKAPFRFTLLFFTCMLTFGSYFCFGTLG